MSDKKKPERVPVDADYVMKIAKTVHETFKPQITFAKDPRGEEIAQAVAFVLLTEKRFQDMGLKIEERTAIIQAALRILADGNARAEAAARELAAPFVANAAEAAKPAEGQACEVVPLRPLKKLGSAEEVREIGARDDYFADLRKENPPRRIEQSDVDAFNDTALAKMLPSNPIGDVTLDALRYCGIQDANNTYCSRRAWHEGDHEFPPRETPEPEGPKSA